MKDVMKWLMEKSSVCLNDVKISDDNNNLTTNTYDDISKHLSACV